MRAEQGQEASLGVKRGSGSPASPVKSGPFSDLPEQDDVPVSVPVSLWLLLVSFFCVWGGLALTALHYTCARY